MGNVSIQQICSSDTITIILISVVFSVVWKCKNRFYYPTCKLNIGAPLQKFVVFFLFIFFVEHLYFPTSSFFTTHCKIITSHRKDVFVSESIFKIRKKKCDFHLYFLFSLGRVVLRISLKISQGTKEGAKIKVVFIISLSLSLKLQSMVILYCCG